MPLPTCSATYSPTIVPRNSSTVLSVTSQGMPPRSYSSLHGTKNGITDEFGSVYNLTSGNFTIGNTAGRQGDYMRYVVMKAPNDEVLCQTAPTYASFLP